MTFKTEISVSEFKAILELLQEVCKISGVKEDLIKKVFKKMNENHLK